VSEALKGASNCRKLGMEAKRRLYEGVAVLTVLPGLGRGGVGAAESRRLNVSEMIFFWRHGWIDAEG
jgi:hypothetical protein